MLAGLSRYRSLLFSQFKPNNSYNNSTPLWRRSHDICWRLSFLEVIFQATAAFSPRSFGVRISEMGALALALSTLNQPGVAAVAVVGVGVAAVALVLPRVVEVAAVGVVVVVLVVLE